MRRRDLLWRLGLAPLTACRRTRTGPPQVIQFGVQPFPGMSIFYLAMERGYFRGAGLDIRPQVFSGGAPLLTALARDNWMRR